MKVLFMTAHKITDPCGVVSHIQILGKGFQELGHDADYISPASFSTLIQRFIITAPHYFLLRLSANLAYLYYFSMIKFLMRSLAIREHRNNNYDLWNAQDFFMCDSASVPKKKYKVPLIHTVHSYASDVLYGKTEGSFAERFTIDLERRSFKSVDKTIAVDSRIKKYLMERYGVPGSEIEVKINFVDTNDFKPRYKEQRRFREKLGLPADKLLILCPRRLVEKNGVIYGALAAKLLKKQLKKDFAIVFIGGEGPEAGNVRKILKKDKTEGNVIMLPEIDHGDMKYLYNAVDLVIIPSVTVKDLEEATSISALEAMASGVPVIASNIGGLKEIIEDGRTGFMVEQKKPEQLAAKIVHAAGSDNKQVTKNAREFVKKNCSHIERAKEYIEMLKKWIE